MDFKAKAHPCYFNTNYVVSCTDKKNINLKMETMILELLKDIENRQIYLPNYWYILKYFVWVLHAVYRLLYKVLVVHDNSSMKTKLKCHNLINGPRTIAENFTLFKELVSFTQIQTQLVGAQLRFVLNVKFQDTISQIFFRLTTFLKKIFGMTTLREI